MEVASTQPRPALHFRENQGRRKERIRDVGGHVHLEAIQPEQAADDHHEQKVEAVERRAADEGAKTHRDGFARAARPFESKIGEQSACETHRGTRPDLVVSPIGLRRA